MIDFWLQADTLVKTFIIVVFFILAAFIIGVLKMEKMFKMDDE